MRNTSTTIIILLLICLTACDKEATEIPTTAPEPMDSVRVENQNILNQLATNYEQLPEQEIAISLDSNVYAQYAMPTDRYPHGILGDRVEGGQLVVVVAGVFYELTLEDIYVFEDIRPRLYDVDGDGELEFITLRTHVDLGGGITIYKIINEQLVEYAQIAEIGRSFRWVNVVTINDLDNDGIVEVAWIETPHIGGILKVAKIENGTLQVIAETAQYSNHAIGEQNLCLSALTEQAGQKIIYVPNQRRNKIVGFIFENDQWQLFKEIDQIVDFSKPLVTQYLFDGVLKEEDNCI